MSRPLVTFALFAYNQEKFIRESVKGALAQTYSPLQIILSDDCSQDRTFEIMREEVGNYVGPHEIILNRNMYNLGLGGHINRVVELTKGELIVVAAGDDVSLSARTEELVSAWLNGGIYCVWSDLIQVDECGKAKNKVVAGQAGSWKEVVQRERLGGLGGASSAWDRAVFDVFGPLPTGVIHEDYALWFRAALLGKIARVNKPLVMYRLVGITQAARLLKMDIPQVIEYHSKNARAFGIENESWLRDLQLFLRTQPEIEAEAFEVMDIIEAKIRLHKLKGNAADSDLPERLHGCLSITKDVRKLGVKQVIKACLLSLAPTTYYTLQYGYHRFKEFTPSAS
jgi:glycosyltransferase involved in cell wall biosynthesis